MVGAAGQEDAERGLEAGGARPREAHADHLEALALRGLALVCVLQYLLEIGRHRDLPQKPALRTHTLLDILSLLCRMSFKIVTDNLIKMLTRTFNAIIARCGEI